METTLSRCLHEQTNLNITFKTEVVCLCMFTPSFIREKTLVWFDKVLDDLKRLNTLYVILLPSEETLLSRLKERGDEFQDESILKIRSLFLVLLNVIWSLSNVLVLEEDNLDKNIKLCLEFFDSLNSMPGQELIKSLVINSGRNELVDVQCKEKINTSNLDYTVLEFPQEKEYYEKIRSRISDKIFKEFTGLNEHNVPQKHDTRRVIYTGNSCISFIHALFRQGSLNISVTLRSSNVVKTLWADYEFLKILSVVISEEMNLEKDCQINLTVNIRSAHIVP